MDDIETVKDAYESLKITDMTLVRSEQNISDDLTKSNPNSIMFNVH